MNNLLRLSQQFPLSRWKVRRPYAALLFAALLGAFSLPHYKVGIAAPACDPMGWFPTEFGLQDHTVFWHAGYYYIAAIYQAPDDRFAYGRSADYCTWEDLTPILPERVPGAWDERSIWAPFVYQEGGVYYMFYTGVTNGLTQSIMLATSTDPSDPNSWQPQGMVFQPNHPGMVWQAGEWADCRDPNLIKVEDVYYLYYTGRDVDGGIVGVATATSPLGPWEDWGRVVPPDPFAMPESAAIFSYSGRYYLSFSRSYQGEVMRIGASPAGPWKEPAAYAPGWAHEFWQDVSGAWHTSYLTDHTITISPLTWDHYQDPPWPFIGKAVWRAWLPATVR